MRLNIHLPGPFSVSTRLTPKVKPPRRAARRCDCRGRASQPARTANPRPQDRTLADGGTSGGMVTLWLLGLTLVILAILGFGGFRV